VNEQIRALADAVLYEGYLLWPYRRSALKNRQRWGAFGGVYPRAHSEERDDDPWRIVTECLLLGGDDAEVEIGVRFLQVIDRQLLEGGVAVDELTAGGQRHLSWEEARERELLLGPIAAGALLAAPRELPVDVPADREDEALGAEAAIARSWEGLRGAVRLSAERAGQWLVRVRVEIENETPWAGGTRDDVLRRTFCSTHTVLTARRGSWVSLTDPPEGFRSAAEGCVNVGAWPVLVGEPGSADTVLSAPIILEDHPRIAPESPGDFFDGGEIDQMLVLNVLSLSDEERAEMRDSDPRAREILERTEALTPDELSRLHGAIREFGLAR
jgi:hypothetical protein